MPRRCDGSREGRRGQYRSLTRPRPYDSPRERVDCGDGLNDFWTASGWWIGAAGFVIGIAGFAYGIWARSNPKKTALQVSVKQRELGMPNDPRLDVRFDGKKLDRPTLLEVTVEHMGGPEIAAADMPSGAIAITAENPVIVGALGRSGKNSALDQTHGRITVQPYQIKEWSTLRLTYLADGPTTYTKHVGLANVGDFRRSWLVRHGWKPIPFLMLVCLVAWIVAASLGTTKAWSTWLGLSSIAWVLWMLAWFATEGIGRRLVARRRKAAIAARAKRGSMPKPAPSSAPARAVGPAVVTDSHEAQHPLSPDVSQDDN